MGTSFILAFAIRIQVSSTFLACGCFRTSTLAVGFATDGIGANQMVVTIDNDNVEIVPIANLTYRFVSINDFSRLVLYLCRFQIHVSSLPIS